MYRGEDISFEQLRLDGRRHQELRTVTCETGVSGADGKADGYASVKCGQTHVIVYVHGPKEAKRYSKGHGGDTHGSVVCEVNVAPFSSLDYRKPRKNDRYSTEMGLRLRKCFESTVMLDRHPRSEIVLSVHIITSDGGVLATAINATTLALLDAGVCMRDLVIASCVGCVQKTVLADMSQAEIQGGVATMTLAIQARTKQIVLCELEAKISLDTFQEMYECGMQSCMDIFCTLRATIIDSSVHIYSRGDAVRVAQALQG